MMSATPSEYMDKLIKYEYSWNDAIKNKYICDFTIYIPDHLDTMNNFMELIEETCTIENPVIVKKAYFMIKSLLYNGNKKCICYMTTIAKAEIMCNILSWMMKLLNVEIEYWQIDSMTKKAVRNEIINNFITTKKLAIIVNVHVLEGINIPECDSVFISQPSYKMTTIIQRMCRANRIINNKSMAYIYMWCSQEKTDAVLEYIFANTKEYVRNKIYMYNTDMTSIKQYTKFNVDNDSSINKQMEIIKN
jgi:superfamily II DNA or RNA helicase